MNGKVQRPFYCVLLVIPLVVGGFALARKELRSSSLPQTSLATSLPLNEQKIELTLQEGTSMGVALSPDGKRLAIDLVGSLWVLPATGGEAVRITDEFHRAQHPTWSPDGQRVAFQSFRDGMFHIWAVNADGTGLQQLTFGPFDDREPHWSNDGSRIAFSSDRSGNYDVWVLDLRSDELQQITKNPANDFMPSWSPDDREIAFVSDRQASPGVWAATPAGAERLLFGASGSVSTPVWSPSGKQVLFNVIADGESRLWLGGKAITSGEDVFPSRAQWVSEDEFFYTADGKIKKRSLSTGTVSMVAFKATVTLDRPSYSRKGRDFDSREPQPVLGIVKPTISPDGKQIAFGALGDLWLMPVGGQPKRLTNDAFLDTDPAWSPDGTQLAFSSDREGTLDIWVHELQTGKQRRITKLPTAEMGPAWSRDGTQISFLNFVSSSRAEISVAHVQSGEVRRLHDALFQPGYINWSPDGQTVVLSALRPYSERFREGINQILAISEKDGSTRNIVPVADRSVGVRGTDGPVWSPDGRMIAFVMEGTLHVMPVNRQGEPIGPPRQLTSELADAPSWTGDSRQLLYLATDRLKMVSLDDGRVREIPLDLKWERSIPQGRKVIHASHLFDGRNSSLRHDVDIVVEGNRIRSIEPHRPELHNGEIIDGTGLTVIPGLIEMHTHLKGWYGEQMGRLWLGYGVTSIRQPQGLMYVGREQVEAVEAGVRVGPRLFMTGSALDGTRIYYNALLPVGIGAWLELELERARRLDYDWIKTYVRFPDIAQKRVIEYSHQHGIPVTSHYLFPAVAVGSDGVEHMGSSTSSLGNTYGDVLELLGQSKMPITPTMGGSMFAIKLMRDPSLMTDPRFTALLPPWDVNAVRANVDRVAKATDLDITEARQKRAGRSLLAIARAGGKIVAGTDSPAGRPYALSLVLEVESYVDSGLTTFEALQTATVNAAEALGVGGDLGSIEAGKLADMVLVEGDPLSDIRKTRNVRKVVKNGEVFDLDNLLRKPD